MSRPSRFHRVSIAVPLLFTTAIACHGDGASDEPSARLIDSGTSSGTDAGTSPAPRPDLSVAPDTIVLDSAGVLAPAGDGSTSVDDRGQMHAHIPIWVPPGRAGIQPSLSLEYTSGGGNGPVGVGWGLAGLSRITRCSNLRQHGNVAPPIQWKEGDTWCADGEPLVPIPGNWRYSKFHDDGSVFVWQRLAVDDVGYWQQYTRDGRIYSFGGTANARVFVNNNMSTAAVMSYALSRVEDRAGNFMTVTYEPAGGDIRATRIDYTGSAANTPQRSVTFAYDETRKDVDDRVFADQPFTYTSRLSHIDMHAPNSRNMDPLRTFSLEYGESPTTGRSRLQRISECSGSATTPLCRQQSFTYADGVALAAANAWNATSVDSSNQLISDVAQRNVEGVAPTVRLLDVDGDGKDDLLYLSNDANERYHLRFSTGTTFGPAVTTSIAASASPNLPLTEAAASPPLVLDFDGDGHADVLVNQGTNSSPVTRIYLANHVNGTWTLGGPGHELQVFASSAYRSYEAVDLNGDAHPDLVMMDPTGTWFYSLNTNGTLEGLSVPAPLPWQPGAGQGQITNYFLDLNNDGATEIMTTGQNPGACTTDNTGTQRCDCSKMGYDAIDVGQYLYPGYYFSPQASFVSNVAGLDFCDGRAIEYNPRYTPIFGDFNGDGIVDVIETIIPDDQSGNPPVMNVTPKFGRGDQSFTNAPGSWTLDNPNVTFQTLDADLDGKSDLLVRGSGPAPYTVYSWKGGEWKSTPLALGETPVGFTAQEGLFTTGDVNGDGITDFVAYTGVDSFAIYTRNTGGEPRADLLTGTSGDFTASTIVGYVPYLTDVSEDRSDCQLPLACVTRAGFVVHDIDVDDGVGGTRAQLHAFTSGRADTQGWGFLGFKKHVINDASTGALTTRQFQFPANYSGPTPFYPFVGLPYEVDTTINYKSGTQTFTRTTQTGESYIVQGTGPFMALPNVIEAQTTDSSSGPISMSTTTFAYDTYGNQTQKQEWFQLEDEHRTTTTTYLNDAAHLILGRPTYVSTTSTLSSGVSQTRETAFTYDALGQLAVQIDNPGAPNSSGSYDPLPAQDDGVQTLYTRYTRDANGLPYLVEKLDSLSAPTQRRATQYTYDANESMFVIRTTDPMGLVTQAAYEPGLGVVAATTDVANIPTTFTYDTFGRIRGDHPKGGGDRVVVYHAASAGNFGTVDDHRLGHYLTTTTLDSLRRTVGTTTTGRADGRAVYVETTFDPLGREHSVSRPHFAGVTPAQTTKTYDALGRVTRIDGADGSVITTTYTGNQVTTTNADGNVSRVTNDSLGRPITSVQATMTGAGGLSGHVTTTTLAYGPFDELSHSTDTAGNIVDHQYDRLGRELWARDRDSRTTAHRYDVFGEVTDEIRGASITTIVFNGNVRFVVNGGTDTHITYDADGRALTRSTPDMTQTFVYDSVMPGKLSSASITNGYAISYTYDAAGNLGTKMWNGPRGKIGFSYGYDQYNRLVTTTYPRLSNGTNSLILRNTYSGGDIGGQLTSVDDITIWPVNDWKLVSTDASETFSVTDLPNGVETTLGEDPAHPGWLNTIVSKQDASTIQSLRYTREGGGRVHLREDLLDPSHPVTETFGYDGLERLTTWFWTGAAGNRAITYTYDDLGNLRSRNVLAGPGSSVTYTYAAPFGPHQVASDSSGTSYQYDARGNQLVSPGRNFIWNSFDRPTTVTTPSGTYTMMYDADLARFSRQTPIGDTRYSYGGLFDEFTSGSTTHAVMTVMAGGKPVGEIEKVIGSNRVAVTQASNALLTDALGSIDTIVTTSGHQAVKYDPFGTRVTAADPTVKITTPPQDLRAGFTGHDHDDDVNLIDMIGRVYDPQTQRFLSIDPPAPDPVDGQAYNPYAYVRNNPLNATDPTGYLEVQLDGMYWHNTTQDLYGQYISAGRGQIGFFVYKYVPAGAGTSQGSSGTQGTNAVPGTMIAGLTTNGLMSTPDDPESQASTTEEAELKRQADEDESVYPNVPSDPVARARYFAPGGWGSGPTTDGISQYACDHCRSSDEEFAYASATVSSPFGSASLQIARTGDVFLSLPFPGLGSTDALKWAMKPQVKLGFGVALGFVPFHTSDETLVKNFMSGLSLSNGVAMGVSFTSVHSGPITGSEFGLASPGFGTQISFGLRLGSVNVSGAWGGFVHMWNALNRPPSQWFNDSRYHGQ
jgi:RHS repeat-associated protein